MIIGSGMIANAFQKFKENKEVLIFASGVSNSQEIQDSAFNREKELLEANIEKLKNSLFVYFSTCSIMDPSMMDSLYRQHKLDMEEIIKTRHKRYYIFRLPQVVGRTKSPTLIHYLHDKMKLNEPFDLWEKSTRNLIDVEDVFKIANYIISNKIFLNDTINIAASKSHKVKDIVNIMENIFNQTFQYRSINRGTSYEIDTSQIASITQNLKIDFSESYIQNVITKYYQ